MVVSSVLEDLKERNIKEDSEASGISKHKLDNLKFFFEEDLQP